MPDERTATRVLLACSGLDHARRGFESFARECFEALRGYPGLEVELIKGTGPPADGERSVPTMTRDSLLSRALGRVSGREPFRFEHAAFALSLQPELVRRSPDVVYFSEWHTGVVLAWLRRATGGRYRLVLSNGTMADRGFEHLDLVQQLTPIALETVLALGADPGRQMMLPLGFHISPSMKVIGEEEREGLRRRLQLPAGRRIVLSVAALNRHHKRIDYLVEELARLPEPRPFLLVAGQAEAETEGLHSLARERLGNGGYSFRTVPPAEVANLYLAADVFVLASLGEAQGRALIEALSYGVSCLAHDYPIARFALGDHGYYGDFTRPGALAELLSDRARPAAEPDAASGRHRFAYDNFSWDRLRPRYLEMFRYAASGGRSLKFGT